MEQKFFYFFSKIHLPNFLLFFLVLIWSYTKVLQICLGMLAIVVMAEVKKFEKKKTGFVLVLEDLYKKYFHISPVLVLLESTKADFWLV